MNKNLSTLTVRELLAAYVQALGELKNRGVLRTSNNPVGDYTEWLVANTLGLKLLGNSTAAYDAVDNIGVKYPIKGRRQTPENMSTQLGMFHNLNNGGFDYLIAILFHPDFTPRIVVKVPHAVVAQYSRFHAYNNAHILHIQGSWLTDSRVEHITNLFV